MYEYLIVGAGLYGAVFAREMTDRGNRCLVIDRRSHIGGNVYTENQHGIHIHRYGPHIFHTSDETVWDYVNRYVRFNNFIYSPLANNYGKLYNLPFNMNMFRQLWGVKTPDEAKEKIESQRLKIDNPKNLEEQALSLGGKDVYEVLIKAYTEKQWGRPCSELPAFIIKRLPFRFMYDNNYFNDSYQGIPQDGYTALIEKLLDGIEVRVGTPYRRGEIMASKTIYTGAIDEFFDYELGALEYRSLRFSENVYNSENIQGVAVINYTSDDVPFTRSIEHRHFDRYVKSDKTIITFEYPATWQKGDEPYYPVNDEKNNALYKRYVDLAKRVPDVVFGGRLGQYKYFDMDKTILAALEAVKAYA